MLTSSCFCQSTGHPSPGKGERARHNLLCWWIWRGNLCYVKLSCCNMDHKTNGAVAEWRGDTSCSAAHRTWQGSTSNWWLTEPDTGADLILWGTEKFVQILHSGSNHWITVGMEYAHVHVYDSVWGVLPYDTKKQIAALLMTDEKEMIIEHANNQVSKFNSARSITMIYVEALQLFWLWPVRHCIFNGHLQWNDTRRAPVRRESDETALGILPERWADETFSMQKRSIRNKEESPRRWWCSDHLSTARWSPMMSVANGSTNPVLK